VLSSDEALYHIEGAMGNREVFRELSVVVVGIGIRIDTGGRRWRGGDRMVGVKSWVEISERRLAANYKVLSAAAGGDTTVLAVVKANAYGHGAGVCAPMLARAGANWFGVADATEGCAVREAFSAAGIDAAQQPAILVMCGGLGEDADAIVQQGLTAVVWERQQMEGLAEAVARRSAGLPLAVHLEIDTGMARQGVAPGEELEAVLRWFTGQSRLRLDGVMTHFASAEVAGSRQTVRQRELFEQAIEAVAAAGLRPTWVHAGNSSTIDNQGTGEKLSWLRGLANSVGARSMARAGIALYGYCLPICLPIEDADSATGTSRQSEVRQAQVDQSEVRKDLQPVMTWKTRVIGLRNVQAGDAIGYNATFTAPRPMRLALLPIGYSDGLRRELSSSDAKPGGWVMLHGQRAAIVGRVSMNLTVVDVSEISAVAVGDEVVVLGDGVTADDHARLAGTISYEIVCGVHAS
jgi:alanine racemase